MNRQKGDELESTYCVEIPKLYSPEHAELNSSNAAIYKEMYPVLFTLCMFGINFHKRFILFCHEFDRREIAWNIYSMIILLLIVTKISRWIGIFQTQVHRMVIFVYSLATVWCVQRMAHLKGEPAVKNSAYVLAAIFWILVLGLTTLDAYCHHLHGEDNIFGLLNTVHTLLSQWFCCCYLVWNRTDYMLLFNARIWNYQCRN